MKLRDPCKKCLVRAACKKGCEDNYDFHNTRYKIVNSIINTIICISMIVAFLGSFSVTRFLFE